MIEFNHPIYGKCYTPHYSGYAFNFTKPEIYNKYGERMDIFYLRDCGSAHSPYGVSKKVQNRYFLWDRYNFGLEVHFYIDVCIGEIIRGGGQNQRNFAMLVEPRSIDSRGYELLYNNRELAKEFEKIFTHDEALLDALPNAYLNSNCAKAYCYVEGDDELTWSEDKWQSKSKDISMIVSGKEFTPLHLLRNATATYVHKNGIVDVFGNFVGRYIKHKSTALDSYRYHIAMENERSAYYFTEKIIDCFISMAVPIYVGATRIGDFFNEDGIITLKDGDNIDEVLKRCTKEDYESRLPAIIDNYNRSLKYINTADKMYEELFLKDS